MNNREQHERLQKLLIQRVAEVVKEAAEKQALDPDAARDLAETLTFRIGSLLDGAEYLDDNYTQSTISFTQSKTGESKPHSTTWMHEIASEVVESVFGDDNLAGEHEEQQNRHNALKYCSNKHVQVPPLFGANRPVCRYAIIRNDRTPPRLLASTWDQLGSINRYLNVVQQMEPNLAVGMFIEVLDLHLCNILKLQSQTTWEFVVKESFLSQI